MPPVELSFDESWFIEVQAALEEKFGELSDQAKALILAAAPLVIVGHREGLVEVAV